MLKLAFLLPLSLGAADLLGVVAMFLTPGVEKIYVIVPCAAALLAVLLRLRVRDNFLLPLIAAVVFAGLFAAYFSSASATAVLSRCVIGGQALLWAAAESKRYRFWRLGIAFIEIVLAAILAPETRMFFLIFAFVLSAAFALAFGFLERNFAARDPDAVRRPLRPAFLGAVSGMAVLVFLGSLLIFPLLPRANWAGLGASSRSEIGYAESVSFRDATSVWASGESRILLRLYLPEGMDEERAVPMGLLRGKALEAFDGIEWRAGVKQLAFSRQDVNSNSKDSVEAIREPMPTEVVPVPYGNVVVEGVGKTAHRYQSGEWFLGSRRGQRVSYRYGFAPGPGPGLGVPRELHLRVPPGFPRLTELAERLKRENAGERSRVTAVMRLFRGFSAELEAVPAASDAGVAPLEKFFFEDKRGHCELFASTAALLFRSLGMPARLVAGFRANRSARDGLLAVRNTDAHAWVEVWTKERGWIPVDPTPEAPFVSELWQDWRDGFDAVGIFWQRYIVSYELDAAELRQLAWQAGALAPFVLALVLLIASLLGFRALYPRWRRSQEPRQLVSRVRARFPQAGASFEAEYLRLRFGRREPEQADIKRLHALGVEESRRDSDRSVRGVG